MNDGTVTIILYNFYKMFTQKTTVDVEMVKNTETGLCSDAALAMELTCKGVSLFPTSQTGSIGIGTG